MDRGLLTRFGEVDSDIDTILRRSHPATCGVMEREINLKTENVAKAKATLRKKGFVVIGTSEPGKTRKVWFIRSGGF